MSHTTAVVECPLHDSFRVQQLAGMFDVPIAERCRETFSVEIPSLDEAWTIGAIVGPSGSGKSTVARHAFGDYVYRGGGWASDRVVIDGFGELPTKQIVAMLTAVGFSTPPSWIKPYSVLSNGEQFRCDLARALLMNASSPMVVFDEFSSVVDRTVAKIGSAAVSRTIRAGNAAPRFVAVTCHYDVLEWLEPDWVLDMATGLLTRGRLRRPTIALEVVRCPQAVWKLFARHHYLSGELSRAATCYAALWNGEPIAFCGVTGVFGKRGRKRVTRLVVLPDYQGLGIGMRLVERVCEHEQAKGFRCNITAAHPSVIGHCKRSPLWRAIGVKRAAGKSHQQCHGLKVKTAEGRSVVSFEFVGIKS